MHQVLYSIFFNDTPSPVTYGPDISATGQPNQRLLHITTSNNENYTLNPSLGISRLEH